VVIHPLACLKSSAGINGSNRGHVGLHISLGGNVAIGQAAQLVPPPKNGPASRRPRPSASAGSASRSLSPTTPTRDSRSSAGRRDPRRTSLPCPAPQPPPSSPHRVFFWSGRARRAARREGLGRDRVCVLGRTSEVLSYSWV
jgi:hypothetical protein